MPGPHLNISVLDPVGGSVSLEIKVKSRVEPADRRFPSMLNPGIGNTQREKMQLEETF